VGVGGVKWMDETGSQSRIMERNRFIGRLGERLGENSEKCFEGV